MRQLTLKNSLGKYFFYLFCFLGSLMVGPMLQAQNVNSLLKKGQREYTDNNIELGLKYFENALSKDRGNYTAAYFAGISYLRMAFPKKGLKRLSIIRPERFKLTKDIYYWLAYANFKNDNFDEALALIKSHRTKFKNLLKEDIETLETSIISAKALYADKKPFKIENLGDNINSDNPEYSAVLTDDHRTIHFTTRRKENKGGEKSGEYMEDILSSSLTENDQWSKAARLKGLVTVGHDATVQLFGDDKKMIIYQKRDLFVTEFNNGKWSSPQSIGKNINNTKSRESHGFVSKDGKTLIFSSDNKNKNGNLDLYIANLQSDGEWGRPRPINELNTDMDEDSPYLAKDGTLYFSSKGHNSMGGFDIFKSEYNPTSRKYGTPKNMGYPLNSVSDDIFFTVKNGVAYFTSNRAGGLGREDIYRAFLFENINFSLEVLSSTNRTPVPNAVVHIKTSENKISLETDQFGKLKTILPAFQDFQIQVVKDGEILLEKELSPLTTLKNPEDFTSVVEIGLPQNENISSLETKEELIADYNDNKDTDEKLVINNDLNIEKVENENSNATVIENQNTASQENTAIKAKTKELDAKFKSTSGKFVLKRIFFDHNEAMFKSESYDELNAILAYLKENKSIRAEISGHTDNIGPVDYNKDLSYRRAKAIVDYLINNGIDPSRLVAKGYGESRPLVSNDDEKEGREINRRIELKVLKSGDGFSKNN